MDIPFKNHEAFIQNESYLVTVAVRLRVHHFVQI